MSADTVPPPDADVWDTAVTLLEEGLGVYPDRSVDQVRFCGIAVGNTAVLTTASEVRLRVTHADRPDSANGVPAKPAAVWELCMPPAFARYLAALLDSHARYLNTAT